MEISTHTQVTEIVSDENREKAFDALLDISAFLFVDYFSKYGFEKTPEVKSYFSLLPPELRYKVLNNLYEMDSSNIAIIDKLCISILKFKGEAAAYTWLKIHESELKNIPSMPEELQNSTIYDTCSDKIKILSAYFASHDVIYKTFEEAILYYREFGKIQGNTPEIVEFNDIMELLYIGRRPAK